MNSWIFLVVSVGPLTIENNEDQTQQEQKYQRNDNLQNLQFTNLLNKVSNFSIIALKVRMTS